MKTLLKGFILLLIFAGASWAQTRFEDAVALNFRNSSVASAGFFDNDLNLHTAMVVKKDGLIYLEIGKYDQRGGYAAYRTFELRNDPVDVKIKFNTDGSRLGVLEISPEITVLSVFDLSAGVLINDIDIDGGTDFFMTPDTKYALVSGVNNTALIDVFEGEIAAVYNNDVVLGISGDGSRIFTRSGNNINYLETKTGKKIRSLGLTGFKTIEFDERGELILCSFGNYVKLFKLTEGNFIGIKEVLNVSAVPRVSSDFNYFVVDNAAGSERVVVNIGGTPLYKSKIENYNPAKTVFAFSKDEKRMAVLSDKGVSMYDFDMIRYYNVLVQKYPDLFQQDVKFETDKDQENRADRVKLQKDVMVKNVADEMKVSEGLIRQAQKSSLGLVEVSVIGLGVYDPATELYDITLAIPVDYVKTKNVTTKVKVPKFQAEVFTNNAGKFKAYALRQLNREMTGLDVFDVIIVNDLNSTNYRCIMHRTLPVNKKSYEEQYNAGQKAFELRDWYEAIFQLSDMPEDFSKNNTVDYMLKQAIPAFFDDKWSYVSTLSPVRDSLTLLKNLSDFPKTFKQYSDVERIRQITVNSIMDARLEYAQYLNSDKRYSDAIEFMDAMVTPKYYDMYTGVEYDYEYYKSKAVPFKNSLLVLVAKRSMDGGNYTRAIELLNRVTPDYPDQGEVQRMLEESKRNK